MLELANTGNQISDSVTELVGGLLDALHRISLASQNSMSSKEECGRIAREALENMP
jgi:hypothetical protein